MRRIPRIAGWVCMLLCICLLFTSCARADNQQPTPTPNTAQNGLSNTVVMYLPVSTGELNVLQPGNRQAQQLLSLVYEDLVVLSEDGRVNGNLALSWTNTTLDNGSTRWTFTLRDDVNFQDGSPLVADDVLYTMAQIRGNPQSPYYAQLSGIEQYDKLDDHRFYVDVSTPNLLFVRNMQFPVVSRSLHQQDVLPCGTGPYCVTQVDVRTQVQLQANPGWWRVAPEITQINCLYLADATAAQVAFSSNQLDLFTTTLRTAGSFLQTDHHAVIRCITQTFHTLVLNFNNTLFESDSVRQAIAMALDRQTIARDAYNQMLLPADMPLPPDDLLYTLADRQTVYSPQLAADLLESDGWRVNPEDGFRYKNGVKLQFAITVLESYDQPQRADAARLIADQLAEVGFDISVDVVNQAAYQKAIDTRRFDCLFAAVTTTRLPDWRFMLQTNASGNLGRYTSAQMDGLLDAFMQATTLEEAKTSIRDICDLLARDCPIITLGFCQEALLYNTKLQNITQTRADNILQTITTWKLNP